MEPLRPMNAAMKTLLRTLGGVSTVALLALLTLAVAVGVNLQGYARLTREQPVAELSFDPRGPQRFLLTLTTLPERSTRRFELAGDDWQLDARVLKWRGFANLLGLDARYRLERVSGRYRDIAQERGSPRSVYALGDESALDLWSLAKRYPDWLPFVDAVYGSATYLPMAAGARYEVSLTQSGLIARPQSTPVRNRR
jgi:hypothetical protein